MPANLEPEDLGRPLGGLGRRGGEPHPTRLAAAAGQHLRLHDDRPAELLGRAPRLVGRRHEPPCRDRDSVAREQLLALVLVEIHGHDCRSRAASVFSPHMPFADQLTLARAACAPVVVALFSPPFRPPRLLGDRDLRRGDGDGLVRRPDRPHTQTGKTQLVRLAPRPGRRQGARARHPRRPARPARLPRLDGGRDRRTRAPDQRTEAGGARTRRCDRRPRSREAEDVVAGNRGRRRRLRCRRRLEPRHRLVAAAPLGRPDLGFRARLRPLGPERPARAPVVAPPSNGHSREGECLAEATKIPPPRWGWSRDLPTDGLCADSYSFPSPCSALPRRAPSRRSSRRTASFHGKITALSATSISVGSAHHHLTCSITSSSPDTKQFEGGDRVKIACANHVLVAIADTPTHRDASNEGATAAGLCGHDHRARLDLAQRPRPGDRTLTCSIGPDSPSTSSFSPGDHARISCANEV